MKWQNFQGSSYHKKLLAYSHTADCGCYLTLVQNFQFQIFQNEESQRGLFLPLQTFQKPKTPQQTTISRLILPAPQAVDFARPRLLTRRTKAVLSAFASLFMQGGKFWHPLAV